MNTKLLTTVTAAGIALTALNVNAQEITWDTTIGVESEYVFRGIEIASESAQASIQGNFGDGYFGIWANEPIADEDRATSEYDLYAGYGYAINDTFTADFGATVYYYPDVNVGDDDTFELYAGVSMDSYAAPAFYVYYDFDLEALTLEGSLSHSYNLAEKTALEVGAAGGWVDVKDSEDYFYYKVTADVVYTLAENMSAALGVRAGGNDDHRGPGGKEHNVWGGFTFNASF